MKSVNRSIVLILFILSFFPGLGQEASSLKWLKSKLNYAYYNSDQGKWWLNKFEFNDKDVIHIQNASTENPRKISGKVWIDRRVKLTDLDPYSITIDQVIENKGRIVRGKVLVINAINREKRISKTLDGRAATPETFLQFSIPYQVEDTARNFSDSLKFHLIQAIETSSRVLSSGNVDDDVKMVFEVLRGEFFSGSVTRRYYPMFDNIIEYEDKVGVKPVRKGFFGYSDNNGFFESIITDYGHELTYYQIEGGSNLVLKDKNGSAQGIKVESLHHFKVTGDGQEKEFKRVSYN